MNMQCDCNGYMMTNDHKLRFVHSWFILVKRGKLTNDNYDTILPKSAKLARADGLPQIHKVFKNISSFCPIIDTTSKTHQSVGRYLSELLNPLTHNDYSLKDSFDAATKINRIFAHIRENDKHMFISMDVALLFTNVTLKKTVNIILKRIKNGSKF